MMTVLIKKCRQMGVATFQKFRQMGMATLVITMVVLITLTLMVIFATKVGVFDQRISGNENRYKEAFATAEAGLDMAIQRFNNQFTNNFTGAASMTNIITNSAIAAGTGVNGQAAATGQPSFGVTINNTGSLLGSLPIYQFVSTGVGADGSGQASVSREVTMRKILSGDTPEAPIIVSGSVGTGGNFNIIANPNGGGNGVPVSVWTGPYSATPTATVSMSGSSATCHLQYFDGNNPQCSNPSGQPELISQGDGSTLSAYNSAFPDILPNDANFPSDLFQMLFGISRTDWEVVRSMAALHNQVVGSCAGLTTSSGQVFRLWWVTGDCNMGSNQVIGSEEDPVILVVDDHQLIMGGGGARIYGAVYLFDEPDNAIAPSATFHGSPSIFGSFISDVGGSAMQGSYSIVYDAKVLSNLTSEDAGNYSIAYIPSSWRDF